MYLVDNKWQSFLLDYSNRDYDYEEASSSSSSIVNNLHLADDNFYAEGFMMDGAPFDDPIFSDFGGRSGTGVHSIQVMLGLHGGHHTADLIPPGGHLHKLDSSDSSPPHHQTAHHHLQQAAQQQQQQQQKELKELELAGMYAPMAQAQDVATSTTSSVTPTSTALQQNLQLGNALKRKPDDAINSMTQGGRQFV